MAEVKMAFMPLQTLIRDDAALQRQAVKVYNTLKSTGSLGPNTTALLRAAVSLYTVQKRDRTDFPVIEYQKAAAVTAQVFHKAAKAAEQMLNPSHNTSPAANTRQSSRTTPESSKRKVSSSQASNERSTKRTRITNTLPSGPTSSQKKQKPQAVLDLLNPKTSASKTTDGMDVQDGDRDAEMREPVESESPTARRVAQLANKSGANTRTRGNVPNEATNMQPDEQGTALSEGRDRFSVEVETPTPSPSKLKQSSKTAAKPATSPSKRRREKLPETSAAEEHTALVVTTPTKPSAKPPTKRRFRKKLLQDADIVNALQAQGEAEAEMDVAAGSAAVEDSEILDADLEYRACDFELAWDWQVTQTELWRNQIKENLRAAGYVC